MYVAVVPNRGSPPAVLLREAWREGNRIRKRTVANLSALSQQQIDALRRVFRGETLVPVEETDFDIVRSRPHGAAAAVLGMARTLGLDSVLATRPSRERSVALALICARVLEPSSKLATVRALLPETASSTLADALELGEVDVDECYAALDWLLARQAGIEDIGKTGACELSGGKEEPGHIAKYHCLNATGAKNSDIPTPETTNAGTRVA